MKRPTFLLNKHCFKFRQTGSDTYRVMYKTPTHGDFYVATITDMSMIDAVCNAPDPKLKDMRMLRNMVKQEGIHYPAYSTSEFTRF